MTAPALSALGVAVPGRLDPVSLSLGPGELVAVWVPMAQGSPR